MEDLINQIGMPIIAVLVPLVIAGVKKLLPNIPTVVIPLLAAVIGPAFDLAINAVAGIHVAPGWAMALLGLAGIGLREVKDQVVKVLKPQQQT